MILTLLSPIIVFNELSSHHHHHHTLSYSLDRESEARGQKCYGYFDMNEILIYHESNPLLPLVTLNLL